MPGASTYPPASSPSAGSYANPYASAPGAVPTSEYGPVRDIYDPSFAASVFGGALSQEADRDAGVARFPGLESRTSRRRRTILSGVATALAVVLVVGLIAFAVWQTQKGDDGREVAGGGAGTPPAAGASAGDDDPPASTAGDVAAGAPGTTSQPTATAGAAGTDETVAPTEGAGDGAAEEAGGDEDAGDDETGLPTEEEAAGDEAGAGTAPTPNPGGRSLANLVPAEDEVPEGFILTEEAKFDEAEVAANFGDPDAALAQLEFWGWRGHLQRVFALSPDAVAATGVPTYLVVSVHRFDSSSAAHEALTYFADAVIAAQALEPIEVETLGDESIALIGTQDEANVVNLYIRTGPYLVRVVGGSPDGDPTEVVVELARVVLVNEPDAAGEA
jgi:hypothetical protein